MNIFDKIFGNTAKEVVGTVGSVIDNLSTSDDEKNKAKKELTEVVLSGLKTIADAQKEVLKTELSGNWLQRSWRPLLMLTFTAIVVAKWFGFTDSGITSELEMKLMDIIQLGIGGYIVGRSVEKVTDKVTQNIDITHLKKKDRADYLANQ